MSRPRVWSYTITTRYAPVRVLLFARRQEFLQFARITRAMAGDPTPSTTDGLCSERVWNNGHPTIALPLSAKVDVVVHECVHVGQFLGLDRQKDIEVLAYAVQTLTRVVQSLQRKCQREYTTAPRAHPQKERKRIC